MDKILILNYFLQKVAQKEQALLKLDDIRAAQLAVIYVRPYLFRRFVSGCAMVYCHGFIPMYALELFLILATNAEKHGDHLLEYFDFHGTSHYFHEKHLRAFTEDDLMQYLEKKLYPVVGRKKINRAAYQQLFKVDNDAQLDSIVDSMETSNIRVLKREIPVITAEEEPLKEPLKMIDRAWDRTFGKHSQLLIPENKLDQYANSEAYKVYVKDYDFLKERI